MKEGNTEICNASHLWGQADSYETQKKITPDTPLEQVSGRAKFLVGQTQISLAVNDIKPETQICVIASDVANNFSAPSCVSATASLAPDDKDNGEDGGETDPEGETPPGGGAEDPNRSNAPEKGSDEVKYKLRSGFDYDNLGSEEKIER